MAEEQNKIVTVLCDKFFNSLFNDFRIPRISRIFKIHFLSKPSDNLVRFLAKMNLWSKGFLMSYSLSLGTISGEFWPECPWCEYVPRESNLWSPKICCSLENLPADWKTELVNGQIFEKAANTEDPAYRAPMLTGPFLKFPRY